MYGAIKRRAIERISSSPDEMTDDGSVTPNSDTRKKPRLSFPERDEEEGEDEEEYGSFITTPSQQNGGTPDSDRNNESNTDYQALDDDEAVRRVQEMSAKNTNVTNTPAESAIVEKVTCINFMCHAHLSIDVGPLINFIIGHNGSGKSAVLTALTICLGGKAAATNRGASLKSFIKTDCEAATLSVQIKNQGRSAYKADTYGRSIIVERYFSRSGVSGYRVKDERGKVVSKRREDMDEIIDFFALQLDNPMNVLTQDMSRQFLTSSTNADKYKFFQKGTQLERLDADYRETETYMMQLSAYQDTIKNDKAELKSKWEAAAKASHRMKNQRKISAKMEEISGQICWVQVEEQEKKLDELKSDLRDVEAERNGFGEEIDKINKNLEETTAAQTATEAQRDQVKTELEPLKDAHTDLDQQFKENREKLQSIVHEQRIIKSQIDAQRKENAKCQKDIENEKRRIEINSGDRPAELVGLIEQGKVKVVELQHQQQELEQSFPGLGAKITDAKQQQRGAEQAVDAAKAKVQDAQRQISEIQRGGGEARINPQVKALLNAIQRETRFREKPVGPIWQYVYLQDQKWSSILERSFGGVLDAFIVTSKHDQSILSGLIRSQNMQQSPNIIIGSLKNINTQGYEPPPEFLTWMRAIKITHPLVRDQLIINQAIEQTLLIENRSEAMEAMRRKIPNAKCALCFFDNQVSKRGAGHRIVPGGQSPIRAWEGAQRMRADVEDKLRHANDNLTFEKQAHNRADQELNAAIKKVRQSQQAHAKEKAALDKLARVIERQEETTMRLEDELEGTRVDTAGHETFVQNLEEGMQKLKEHNDAYQASVLAKDEIDFAQNPLKEQMTAAKDSMAVIEKKIEQIGAKIEKLRNRYESLVMTKNQAIARQRIKEGQKEEAEEKVNAQEEVVKEFERQSLESTGARVRVPRGETIRSLTATYEKLQADKERLEQSMGGTEEQLKEKELEAKEAYEQKEENFLSNAKQIQAFKGALMLRRERWKKFQEYIAMRAKASFSYLLSERQFRGNVKIDHHAKTLDIQVEPDLTRKSQKGRTAKTLSGGEKSFSTICLLLALWEAMGSPIRCLDEFDVFMDSVNRDISMKLLIQAARKALSRQFILITPQSMATIGFAPDIRINKMPDPERGQTTLTVGA